MNLIEKTTKLLYPAQHMKMMTLGLLLAAAFMGTFTTAQAAPFSASCDNGSLSISIGQYVARAGSSGFIPVNIRFNDGAIGNFFSRNGYTQNAFQVGLTPMLPSNASLNSYSSYSPNTQTRWEFIRSGNGVRVEAWPNAGDTRQAVNWYFQNCQFSN